MKQLAHRPQHTGQFPPPGGGHGGFDAPGVALHLAGQIAQQLLSGGQGMRFQAAGHPGLFRRLFLSVPGGKHLPLPTQGQGLAALLHLLADGLQPLAQALPLGLLVSQVVQQAFALGVQPVRLLGAGGKAGLGSRPVGLELAALRPLLVQLVHPEGNLQRPQLLPQGQEGLRLLGLGLQRTPLEVQLL